MAAPTSQDVVPWVCTAFAALLSHAPDGVLEYVEVGVLEYVRVGVLLLSDAPVGVGVAAGVEDGAAGAGPLRLALLWVSLRLILGAGVVAGVVTARDGMVLPG